MGDCGDTAYFRDMIAMDMKLYEMKHGYNCCPDNVAAYIKFSLSNEGGFRCSFFVNEQK